MTVNTDVIRFGNIMQDIGNAYAHYAKKLGSNNTSMYLIQIVYNNEPCTQKQICDIMRLPKQTVNTIVRDYTRNGFLEAAEPAGDRRQRQLRLTEKGREYCARILPPISESEAFALRQFNAEERNMLFALMEKYNKIFTKKLLEP